MMYRYLGPLSGVTLNDVEGPALEVRRHGDGAPDAFAESFILFPGAELQLPTGHPYVEALEAQGWLIPVEMPRLKTATKPAKSANAAPKPAEAAQ